jgi:cystathionine gamma-synthase
MALDWAGFDPETIAVLAGRPHGSGVPVNQPPVFSSVFHPGRDYGYGREGNPSWESFEETLGALEGGDALAFSAGMAAVAAVVGVMPPDSLVVAPEVAYVGSRLYLQRLANDGRIGVRFVDVADTEATVAALDEAALLWLESPTNPMMTIADVATLCSQAHSREIPVVVDNTFATPLLQRPLDLGADVVVHSASKYISGHSDVVMGVTITRDAGWRDRLYAQRTSSGGIPGPMETFLALRGLRTLPLRIERAQENAAELARRLEAHPLVERVLYPGLDSNPGHELARKQMRGPGGMLSFIVKGGAREADAVCERVRVVAHLTSLGAVETTIERRAHYKGEEAIPENLLRLSVGVENVEDLWRDLSQALSASV